MFRHASLRSTLVRLTSNSRRCVLFSNRDCLHSLQYQTILLLRHSTPTKNPISWCIPSGNTENKLNITDRLTVDMIQAGCWSYLFSLVSLTLHTNVFYCCSIFCVSVWEPAWHRTHSLCVCHLAIKSYCNRKPAASLSPPPHPPSIQLIGPIMLLRFGSPLRNRHADSR